jgi:hypothetical protein
MLPTLSFGMEWAVFFILFPTAITERSEGYERGGACQSSSDEALFRRCTLGTIGHCFIVERIFYWAFVAECAGPMIRLLQAIADRLTADGASAWI